MFKLEFDIVDVSFFHYCDTCLYNVDGNIKGPLLKYTVIYPNEKKIYLYYYLLFFFLIIFFYFDINNYIEPSASDGF
jgi:hypothetical protein